MSHDTSAIGLMEGAFFVGRKELIQWVNALLGLNYVKVEDCCKVKLSQLKTDAKLEYERIQNFKVLQAAFTKLGITKLVKGKYQDNLEFLQWMKRYYDVQTGGAAPMEGEQGPAAVENPPAPAHVAPKPAPQKKAIQQQPKRPAAAAAPKTDSDDIKSMKAEIADLKLTVDGLERERDFYFQKLRDIEILCLTTEDKESPQMKKILEILYKVDADGEFVQVDETMGQA